jgi:transposase
MAFLSEELTDQKDKTPFVRWCAKDVIEEDLFRERRDLFTGLDIVFFDTTSIYFEGAGGETLGKKGNSKDHRPDRNQMVVGVIIDDNGKPICCEMWPGNTADVKTLVPVIKRLRGRFNIGQICIVSDRGMISAETMAYLEEEGIPYILGARMRRVVEIRDDVLSRPGRYREVCPKGIHSKDPSPF